MPPSLSSGQVTIPALRPQEEGKEVPCSRAIQEGLGLGQPDLNLRWCPSNPEAVRERTAQLLANKAAWHHLRGALIRGAVGCHSGAAAPLACPRAWRGRAGLRSREAAAGARPGDSGLSVSSPPPRFGTESMVSGALFNRGSCWLAPFVSVLPFSARIVKSNLLSTYELVE